MSKRTRRMAEAGLVAAVSVACGADAVQLAGFEGVLQLETFAPAVVGVQVSTVGGAELLASAPVSRRGQFFVTFRLPRRAELRVATGTRTEVVGFLAACAPGPVVDVGIVRSLGRYCFPECGPARAAWSACARNASARCDPLSAALNACRFDGDGQCTAQRAALDACDDACDRPAAALRQCVSVACVDEVNAYVEADCLSPCADEAAAEQAACDPCRNGPPAPPTLGAAGCGREADP